MKRLDGEEAAHVGLSMEVEFKRVATEIIDRLCMEMKERFQRLRQHVGRFGFLLHTDLLLRSMDEETLLKHSADFANFYDEIQSKQLFDNIIDTRVLFHDKEVPKAPKDVLKKLATYDNDVRPNLTVAIRILITLATSIASCERRFSKLKLIESYLRSTMCQDRLNSLVMMSVESDVLDKIDLNNVIDIFCC